MQSFANDIIVAMEGGLEGKVREIDRNQVTNWKLGQIP